MRGRAFDVHRRDLHGAVVLELRGVLDATTYSDVRDVLLKTAIDEPRAVIVDLGGLAVPYESAYTLFSSVSEQLALWPGVPLLVAAGNEVQRRRLDTYRLARFVPTYPSVGVAAASIGEPPRRRIARRTLPNTLASSRHARRFVTEVCTEWSVGGRTADAIAIVAEFVENTLLHTYSAPSIRLELRDDLLTVAVYDDDPAPAQLAEPDSGRPRRGLLLVSNLARAWGCVATHGGGKVVWATLR